MRSRLRGVQAVPDWIPTVETIALAVQAMATIVLLVVTWQLVRATKAMASSSQALVNENKRPRVLVKLKPWIEDSQFMDLILENVGRGAALNVMFQLRNKEVLAEHGIRLQGGETPINFISSGESECYFFAPLHSLAKTKSGTKELMKPVRVNTTYEDVDGRKYEEALELDVRQFSYIIFPEGSSVRQSKMLERIAKAIEKRG